jgi:hypothetical protein
MALSHLVQMRKDVKQCHEELIVLLESNIDLTGCEHCSVSCHLYLAAVGLSYICQVTGTLVDVGNRSVGGTGQYLLSHTDLHVQLWIILHATTVSQDLPWS